MLRFSPKMITVGREVNLHSHALHEASPSPSSSATTIHVPIPLEKRSLDKATCATVFTPTAECFRFPADISLPTPKLFSQGAFEGSAATHQCPRAPQVWQQVPHPPPPCPGRGRAGRESLSAHRCGFPLGIIIPAALL